MLIPLWLVQTWILYLADDIIQLILAMSRRMTINEINKPWLYKYNFLVKNVNKTEKKLVYMHKFFNICLSTINIIAFLLGSKLATENNGEHKCCSKNHGKPKN